MKALHYIKRIVQFSYLVIMLTLFSVCGIVIGGFLFAGNPLHLDPIIIAAFGCLMVGSVMVFVSIIQVIND